MVVCKQFTPRALARSFCLLMFCILASGLSAAPTASELIRQRLEAPGEPMALSEPLYNRALMMSEYESRAFKPIWITDEGALPKAYRLVDTVGEAALDAMRPEDYHLAAVSAQLAGQSQVMTVSQQVDLELALSDMFLSFAAHSLKGRINPTSIDPEWSSSHRDTDLTILLSKVAEDGKVAARLAALQPSQPGYLRLKQALADYRRIAASGGWPGIPAGGTLKRGMDDPRVLLLRTRLGISVPEELGTVYDAELESAVKVFQRRHGLEVDGAVGRETLAELNQSAASRAQTIAMNMERWRWLPESLGERHIRVNIASFELEAWEGGQRVASQSVVVGRDYRRTPVFSGEMTYLVFNPTWEVPSSIARKDLLKQIQADPGYLSRMNMQVLRGWGADEIQVDPSSVQWSSMTERSLPYRFRQLPGENNALGRVKLMFPNVHAVYLHDTPARNLFAKAKRDFSSGCIRLEQPLELSSWVLEGTPNWDRGRIDREIAGKKTTTVKLKNPVQVHLLYWTAWVDENDQVHFRRDIYGRDARLQSALQLPPPKMSRSDL